MRGARWWSASGRSRALRTWWCLTRGESAVAGLCCCTGWVGVGFWGVSGAQHCVWYCHVGTRLPNAVAWFLGLGVNQGKTQMLMTCM